jgi:restriction system protein
LLHRIGYTEEEYDGDLTGIGLFHKYKHTAREEYEGVLDLFVEMWPSLMEETSKKGSRSLDPTPFIHACFEKYGKLGLEIAMEQIEAINRGLNLNPHSPIRYTEWKNIEKLESLFSGSSETPFHGEFIDQRFIDYLSNNPEKLATIHWRKFEELTAEYFSRAGFQVELGPGQNDGGVDVRIWKPRQHSSQAPHCIIQCKRQKQKIEKVIVKGLFCDIQFENADYGLIVTSSELSRGARKTIIVRGYPIKEVNKASLTSWLSELRTPGSGIVRV